MLVIEAFDAADPRHTTMRWLMDGLQGETRRSLWVTRTLGAKAQVQSAGSANT